MARSYSVARSIEAPVETVWALLTDPSGYREWNTAVVSIEGSIVAGGRIELVSIASPARTFTLTVTVLEPPHRMVWADGMPLGLFRGVRTFLLDRDGPVTRFSMTEEFTGMMAGLVSRSIPDLTPSFQTFADGLKAAAERVAR